MGAWFSAKSSITRYTIQAAKRRTIRATKCDLGNGKKKMRPSKTLSPLLMIPCRAIRVLGRWHSLPYLLPVRASTEDMAGDQRSAATALAGNEQRTAGPRRGARARKPNTQVYGPDWK